MSYLILNLLTPKNRMPYPLIYKLKKVTQINTYRLLNINFLQFLSILKTLVSTLTINELKKISEFKRD